MKGSSKNQRLPSRTAMALAILLKMGGTEALAQEQEIKSPDSQPIFLAVRQAISDMRLEFQESLATETPPYSLQIEREENIFDEDALEGRKERDLLFARSEYDRAFAFGNDITTLPGYEEVREAYADAFEKLIRDKIDNDLFSGFFDSYQERRQEKKSLQEGEERWDNELSFHLSETSAGIGNTFASHSLYPTRIIVRKSFEGHLSFRASVGNERFGLNAEIRYGDDLNGDQVALWGHVSLPRNNSKVTRNKLQKTLLTRNKSQRTPHSSKRR